MPWVFPRRFWDAQADTTEVAIHQIFSNIGAPLPAFYHCKNLDSANGTISPTGALPDSQQRMYRRAYRAAMSFTDYNIGRLLNATHMLGVAENTIVVFHGDHGWNLGEHGGWCKQSNFDLVARIPMLLKVPGRTNGVHTNALVEAVDIYPTLLELANITVPDAGALEGASFAPLISDPNRRWKTATFTQYPRCGSGNTENNKKQNDTVGGGSISVSNLGNNIIGGSSSNQPPDDPTNACTGVDSTNFLIMGYSVRTDLYRYTRWMHWNGTAAVWDKVVGEELYDHTGDTGLDTDAFENKNLASDKDHASILAAHAAILKQGWRHSLPPPPSLPSSSS